MKTFTGANSTLFKKNIPQGNFYSFLLKHQLKMIEAWTPSQSDSLTSINPGQLTEVFLKFRDIQKNSVIKPSIDSQKALKSYQNEKTTEERPSVSKKNSLIALANRIATKNNVPPSLFEKLIQAESSFDPRAKSSRGAMGLGQLMPSTAKELGLKLEDDNLIGSVWHPESNLNASAKYLKKLFDKYTKQGILANEAWNFAAGAYNAGMGNIGRAMEKLSKVEKWDQVAAVLPQVTGKFSAETIKYVNRLRA